MANPTTEFFEELGRRGHEPLLENATGSMRFDLKDGRRTERWLVEVKKGDIAVSRRNVRADCVVVADRELFDRIVSGRTNAMAALLREEIGVAGNVNLLVAFQRLVPGPPRGRKPRRRARAARRNP